MLSKAEVQYLQGQKIVSKSYERKLKCLIKRKMDVLRKEIPLLSKLILDSSGKYDDIMYRIKEVGKLSSFDNHGSDNELNLRITNNQATKYSNSQFKSLECVDREGVKSLDLDKSSSSVDHDSTPATEYSNVECDTATKNSNSNNSINIARCSPNPLTNTPISHENLNKSIQNDLISEWAGSDSNQRPPPCQGSRYSNES